MGLTAGFASAAPPVVVRSSIDSVTVTLTAPADTSKGVSYSITHWPDGSSLVSGNIETESINKDPDGRPCFSISGLKPKLWSTEDPQLYTIAVSDTKGAEIGKSRFGFRTFEVKDRRFYLNGRPIFLRGLPINPPGRDIDPAVEHDPAFIRGYLKLLKSAGVNIIRTEPQDWLDACDELGMMLFAGHYGGAGGSGPDAPPFDKAQPFYHNLILDLSSHPSVMIYVLTNEVDYKTAGSTYKALLTRVRDDLRNLDPTRPVIGNAGFGHGEPGEVYDVHHYYGWYAGNTVDWYGSFRDFLNAADKADQPLTLTECVGAYTSDSGEFETMSKQMPTMMQWVGTAQNVSSASLEYQAELTRQIVEIARRCRTDKTAVAGIMPFSYYLGWARAKTAGDIILKPAFETIRTVFQPVLISPECWSRNIYAGDALKMRLCVANDSDSGRDLAPSQATVDIVAADGSVIGSAKAELAAVPYYSNAWTTISIPIPTATPRGYYTVNCKLIENGTEMSRNSFEVTVAPHEWAKCTASDVTLFDPAGKTADALRQLGVRFRQITNLERLPESGVLVIAESALGDAIYPDKAALEPFLKSGGRVLCLRQDREKWNGDWLPAKLNMEHRRPYHPFTYIQPMGRNNPIFDGLSSRDLRFFNEIGVISSVIPDVYPVLTPLRPTTIADLKSARVWAACDQLLGGWAMVELYEGKGSVLLSQFRLVERVQHDPVAARLLSNLITYCASNKSLGVLDLTKPIRWDQDAFRAGAFESPLQGFLPHSRTYSHAGTSKGRLGDDHRIDGATLVGDYTITANGWLRPVPDPTKDGWGIFFGQISRPVAKFAVRLRNPGNTPAKIELKLDGKTVGSAVSLDAGEDKTIEWPCARKPGPVEVELRGDQRLVILKTCFQ